MDLGNTVVVENSSGIGFEIHVPITSCLHKTNSGEPVKVFTYLKVQEDDMSLYGFDEKEELKFFQLLITVNGVGPKAAMSILSTLSLDGIKQAIIAEDAKSIASANGIGKKTAERVILELRDKLSDAELQMAGASPINLKLDDAKNEAISALVALGYSKNEAFSAVSVVNEEDLSSEEYVKKALKNLL